MPDGVFVGPGQIAAILPSTTPVGDGTVTVTYAGRASNAIAIRVVKSGFGIYTAGAIGSGPGSITTATYALNTYTAPARQGDIVVIWGTGLGAAPGDDAAGPQPGVKFDGVSVYIGNQPAKVLYAGRSGSAALDQINVEIPNNVPDGCSVPVSVESDSRMSNHVSIAIDHAGRTCTNESGLPADLLIRAARGDLVRWGAAALGPIPVVEGAGFPTLAGAAERIGAVLGIKIAPSDVAQLRKAARARDRTAAVRMLSKYGLDATKLSPRAMRRIRAETRMDQFAFAAGFGTLEQMTIAAPQTAALFPPAGTCTVVTSGPVRHNVRSGSLDAGPSLTLSGPVGARSINRLANGAYEANLGSGFSGSALPAGTYQASGPGGRQVGAFSVALDIGSPIKWENKRSVSDIDRSKPLTITWSGGPESGYVLIGGWSGSDDGSAAFACVELAGKGTFTVPAPVLSSLAPTGSSGESYIFIAQHPLANLVSIPGVDRAYFWNASADYGAVKFR